MLQQALRLLDEQDAKARRLPRIDRKPQFDMNEAKVIEL